MPVIWKLRVWSEQRRTKHSCRVERQPSIAQHSGAGVPSRTVGKTWDRQCEKGCHERCHLFVFFFFFTLPDPREGGILQPPVGYFLSAMSTRYGWNALGIGACSACRTSPRQVLYLLRWCYRVRTHSCDMYVILDPMKGVAWGGWHVLWSSSIGLTNDPRTWR